MVGMRAASKKKKMVCKLAARPRNIAALKNSQGKTLAIQQQLIDFMYQVKQLTDKSNNLFGALISKPDHNKMQNTLDEQLSKILANQEGSRSTMHQLEIQLSNTRL